MALSDTLRQSENFINKNAPVHTTRAFFISDILMVFFKT
jgi:hypothetical protein